MYLNIWMHTCTSMCNCNFESLNWMMCFLLTTLVLVHILNLLSKYLKKALSKRHIHTKSCCGHDGVLGDSVIRSCLVSSVYRNHIVQDSLYHNMDIGTMWHCASVTCTPSQSMGLFWGCALFWCWVSLCVPLTNSLIEFYFIMMIVTIIGILKPSVLRSSGSANAYHPGCFRPWTFPLNIGLAMLHWNSLMSCLVSVVGYYTGDFQAVQLIALAVFGAVDWPLASCMLVILLEIKFEMIVDL